VGSNPVILSLSIPKQRISKNNEDLVPDEGSTVTAGRPVPRCRKRRLEHKPEMLTALQMGIPEDIQATVVDLLKVEVEKTRIQDYVFLRTDSLLSQFQLAALDSEDVQIALDTDTDSLLEDMQDKGECRLFELLMDKEQKRAAILTITNEERQNCERFGDVVLLDGTVVRNSVSCTTYPITRADDEKRLMSGGLLFTAYEREKMFEWLLQSLHDILGATLRTIFTDENYAIVPPMEKFRSVPRPDVAHRICVFHKRVNFVKRLNVPRTTLDIREQTTNLFDEICYSNIEGQVSAAIEKAASWVP
jgi:hypothetical protein